MVFRGFGNKDIQGLFHDVHGQALHITHRQLCELDEAVPVIISYAGDEPVLFHRLDIVDDNWDWVPVDPKTHAKFIERVLKYASISEAEKFDESVNLFMQRREDLIPKNSPEAKQ